MLVHIFYMLLYVFLCVPNPFFIGLTQMYPGYTSLNVMARRVEPPF